MSNRSDTTLRRRVVRAAVTLVSATCLTLGGAAQAADYYAGKTVSLVVPYDPGGSTDTNWRVIAPYFAKHIPGNPEVIIKNMAGGSGNIGANFVYEKARPDGLTLLAGPWNALGVITKAPGVRFDYHKMRFIGGFPDTLMTYVRKGVVDGGLQSPQQIVKAQQVTLAGLRPTSTLDLSSRLSLDLLGVNVKYVPGYKGAAQRTAAIMAGEADASGIGYVGFKSSVEPAGAGGLVGLYYHSPKPIASITDLKDFPSFYREVTGKAPEGEKWALLRTVYLAVGVFLQSMWAPPGTPDEAVAALHAGYLGLMNDAQFKAEATQRFGAPLDFVTPEEGVATVNDLLNAPDPKMVESLNTYIAAGSGK